MKTITFSAISHPLRGEYKAQLMLLGKECNKYRDDPMRVRDYLDAQKQLANYERALRKNLGFDYEREQFPIVSGVVL